MAMKASSDLVSFVGDRAALLSNRDRRTALATFVADGAKDEYKELRFELFEQVRSANLIPLAIKTELETLNKANLNTMLKAALPHLNRAPGTLSPIISA